MKTVALYNLGCKVNSYEMEVMRQILREKGYGIVAFDERADIYIVNTCTVTNIADRKSRQMLHRARQLNRAYIKIQDGCNQFCSYCAIPYARGRVRSRRAEDVLEEVRSLVDAGYREVVLTGIHISSYGIDFGEDGSQAGSAGGAGFGQESVLLRVDSGQVPGNQGALREEPRTDDRARERKRQPAYNGRSRLVELVEQIHGIEGLERIRLGSLEPRIVTPEAVRRLAALPKLCPHFHLSLQSGCDATLKRMNRHYTAGEYYKSVELLRECFHQPAITTDVIAGFPGETEAEFADTREFLEKAGFYEMHVFKYSRREGTAAASMPDQVPEPVKARRSAELIALGERQSLEFRRRYIGKEAEALLEETREIGGRTYCIGHTKDYVKVAVDVTERLQEAPAMINTVVKIPVRDFLTDEILM